MGTEHNDDGDHLVGAVQAVAAAALDLRAVVAIVILMTVVIVETDQVETNRIPLDLE